MFKKNGVSLSGEKIKLDKNEYIQVYFERGKKLTKNRETLQFHIEAMEYQYSLSFIAIIDKEKMASFPHKYIDFKPYILKDNLIYKELDIHDTNIFNTTKFKIMRVFENIFILKINISKYEVEIKIVFDLNNYIEPINNDFLLAV